MEDLTDRDARFLSVEAGCTAADALAVASALGDLHRIFWMSDRLRTGDLLELSPTRSRSTSRGPWAWPLLRMIPRQFHDVVPADVRAQTSTLVTQRWTIAKLIGTYPHTLIHGDTHAGNICLIGDRPMLFDWQVASCGPAVKDLSYFACTSLDTEARRAIETRLVETYVAHLNGDGIERLSFAQAWDAYRMFAFTAYVAAGVTSVFGRRLQSEASTRAGLRRAVQAIGDLDTLAMLRSQLGTA
jgi:Ser/Thr protein kinase RdoA (MazF antagonist)